MRMIFLMLLILGQEHCSAQNIYDYEQEIELSDDFKSIEVTCTNVEDDLSLSGTLIYPKAEYNKVIIIVPGSGRDSRHSHFILAQKFLDNNIAVYRFDERGIGQSGGKYDYTATTLMHDVMSVYYQLRNTEELSGKKIGILGHSLGGIASIGAYGNGCEFDFLVQMATPVENNGAFIKYQARTNIDRFYTVKNKTTDEVINFIEALRKTVQEGDDFKSIKRKSNALIKELDFRKGQHIINPLITDLMQQNHEATYETCQVPMLYIIGSEDRIVSSQNAIKTLERLSNPNVTILEVDKVNHWLTDQLGPTKMKKALYHMKDDAISSIINWTVEK